MQLQALHLTVAELMYIEGELGIDSRGLDLLNGCGGRADVSLWIVAKEGGVNDWAAYSGLPKEHEAYIDHALCGVDLDDVEDVLKGGDKINPALARRLFPEFAALTYRP